MSSLLIKHMPQNHCNSHFSGFPELAMVLQTSPNLSIKQQYFYRLDSLPGA